MLTKQDIYLRLPQKVQQLAVWSASLNNRLLRYGATYSKTLEQARASERWPAERMRGYQAEQLAALLNEAKRGTRYYAEAFAAHPDHQLAEIAASLDLGALPLLEKKVLKQRTPDFFNSLRRRATSSATSGSTGSPLVVEYDRHSIQQRMAFVHRHREWFGAPPLARAVRLSGREVVSPEQRRPPYWVENPLEHQLLVSTYHLRAEALPAIADRISRFRPQVIDGYPTAIAQVARYFDGKVNWPGLLAVVTTAETLTPDLRETIEGGLGVRVYDYYAASEGVPLIQQCGHGAYHLRPETGVFEVLGPDGKEVGPGEVGELVVTGFCQWKTPLIRYRTGDWVRKPAADLAPCTCGRTLPVVAEVLGRLEDLVVTPDGRQIGMFSYRTIKHVPGIREAQIVQRAPQDFLVRWVPEGTREASAIATDVQHVFARVLAYEPKVEMQQVPHIERGPTGKFRSTIRTFAVSPERPS